MRQITQVTYSPRRQIAERFPSWHVGLGDLGGLASELINFETRLIVFDPSMWSDLDSAYAHVSYHLEYHMHRIDRLTRDDCDEADMVAKIRLDSPASRMELTG